MVGLEELLTYTRYGSIHRYRSEAFAVIPDSLSAEAAEIWSRTRLLWRDRPADGQMTKG